MKRPARALLAALLLALCLVAATVPATAGQPPAPAKQPVATGTGGAIATVDLDASAAGLEVLRDGGNAVDAAVAAAATLGVTEAYSAGIGGGGFMVVYLAGKRRVVTIDGRETAPAAFAEDSFIDPATGAADPVRRAGHQRPRRRRAGHPGHLAAGPARLRHPAAGQAAASRPSGWPSAASWSTRPSHDQTASNAARFAAFPATAELFLPGGAPPAVGSVLRNPDLARTYRLLARHGTGPFYRGRIAEAIADTVQDPPVDPASTLNVRPGLMTEADLAAYRALERPPTRVGYRGHQVYGMGPPSSGGSTVGEALNILEGYDLGGGVPHPGPVPLPGGVPAGLRRPQPLGRRPRLRRRAAARAAQPGLRRRAPLPDRRAGQRQPGAARRPVPAVRARLPGRRGGRGQPGRAAGHHPPDGGRPLGQRGQLHPHHRADRRQRHRRPRPRVPAQQRADRLQPGAAVRRACPTPTCPPPASGPAPR